VDSLSEEVDVPRKGFTTGGAFGSSEAELDLVHAWRWLMEGGCRRTEV
jgi:hypothetical protein